MGNIIILLQYPCAEENSGKQLPPVRQIKSMATN